MVINYLDHRSFDYKNHTSHVCKQVHVIIAIHYFTTGHFANTWGKVEPHTIRFTIHIDAWLKGEM